MVATDTGRRWNRGSQLVWIAVAVVDAFLVLRFILAAAGAGTSTFTSIVGTVGKALSRPFENVFATTVSNGHPLLWAAVLALVVYTFAAWIVSRLVVIMSRPSRTEAVTS